ncbi:DUF2919 domain-containing protein [Ferrimonas balearica]|uniref:DUF2919 domain-containing protein n=1 Tax=Ferrimonas balearica TaxID=44012 RepID=UPI001C98F21E|nr:DUF2919 domain-containing protein [Ferrimonas balearica]MBY5990833.1 DUF2919 domain-containing protein [Ferrimonas balearica]
MPQYTFDHFDRHGQLKPGPWLLLTMLLCAKTWLLFALGAASRQSGADLLALFYPDRQDFYLGLLLGLPALALLLASGHRHQGRLGPALWHRGRPLLLASWALQLGLQLKALVGVQGQFHWAPGLTLLASFWLGLYLLRSRHVKTVFTAEPGPLAGA